MGDHVSSVVAYSTLFATVCAVGVAVWSILSAGRNFKKTITLQVETFFLTSYAKYKDAEISTEHNISEECKWHIKASLALVLDIYCKYAIHNLLDKKLVNENVPFFKEIIQNLEDFEDFILKDGKGCSNIKKFMEIHDIKFT
ncbi:hypothetical protein NHP190002_05720 [Helicobacter ailurogastricus]|uniref:hypothetical protein n=1 Tax=Helicobacter ailurogastricus TaxID=1578720 RepID=UPI00244D9729|nr:hypothetical protein [Helicobacter ailurogastricus]GMB89893.1 hypothetical protein NHP190002_05720 [Helicobacter ailurogastricus]